MGSTLRPLGDVVDAKEEHTSRYKTEPKHEIEKERDRGEMLSKPLTPTFPSVSIANEMCIG